MFFCLFTYIISCFNSLFASKHRRKEEEENLCLCVVTQTEGADVDTAAADAGHAANSEEEEGLGEDGRHEAAHGVHAQTHQQHGTLAVPARTNRMQE